MKRVLVADDEENIRLVLGTLLKKEQDLVAFADQLAGGRRWRS